MEFTWGHVFLLAEKMFRLTDSALASKLKTSHSTVYRHKNGDTCRFEPQVDIYKKIFAPPDKTPETLREYFHKLCVSLNSSAFPTDFQKPKYKAYKDSIDYLIAMADENGRGRKSKKEPPLQVKNSNVEKNNALLQAQAQLIRSPKKLDMPDTDVLPLSADIFSTDSDISAKGNQSVQTSKPKYIRDYLKNGFEDYIATFDEVNPHLLQQWSSVRIADEFFYCFELFKIADFVAADPLNFGLVIGEVEHGIGDGLEHILRTLKFVGHMETAIEYVAIYDETEEIHAVISTYVTTLHKYIDFLREHSTNSNLLGNTFILVPNEYDDKDELERKSKKYRNNLQSQYEEVKRLTTTNEAM